MNTEMYSESADKEYVFEITPLDKFDNIVDSSESEVDLSIVWPGTSS